MPRISKTERYVDVAYELHCGFERATALADAATEILKHDPGFDSAKDDTRGWDGDRLSVIVVTYCTLADAQRLDAEVRRLLSRKVDYEYHPSVHTSYGSRGPSSYVTAKTTITQRD